MTCAAYGKGIEAVWGGGVNWGTGTGGDNIKAVAVDIAAYGVAITGATNATPIVITANSHGLSNGQRVLIDGVGGNTNANGVFRVANSTTNTFEIQNVDTGANIAGSGAYTSGGYLIKLDIDQYLSDIPGGARIATSSNLSGKSYTLGVVTSGNFAFTSVSGATIEFVAFYKDTGSAATSPLLFISTGSVTPDGNNVNVTVHANGIFRTLGGP